MATEYTLIAYVASESDPDHHREVKTDGEQLTCSCPGWGGQKHYPSCPAGHGDRCTCRRNPRYHIELAQRTMRTCRHVRAVQPRVDALGGISRVLGLLRAGRWTPGSLGRWGRGEVLYERTPSPLPAPPPPARFRRRRHVGPPPTVITPQSQPHAPSPAAVAPRVESCDLECGNCFFTGQARCRHGRDVTESLRSIGQKNREAVVPQAADLDWLGGRRAIILRD